MLEVNIPEEIKINKETFSKNYMITNNKEYLNNFKYYLSFCQYNMSAKADKVGRSFGYYLYEATKNIICGDNVTTYKQPAILQLLEINNIDSKEIKEEYYKGLEIY